MTKSVNWKKMKSSPDTAALPIEEHPLQPFLPDNARILMLGSFPPKKERWCMDFFYPNFINDMWRIFGLVFFADKNHFIVDGEKRFDYDKVTAFCREWGVAIYDTACAVRRLKDNASDKFLEVVRQTDVAALLAQLPECRAVIVTGQKAAETLSARFGCAVPAVGESVPFRANAVGRELRLWRMPSSSRAYPLALEKKVEVYRTMFVENFDL